MFEMLKSASRIVFIMVAASACGAFFLHILTAEQFMALAVMVFGYYYNKPIDHPSDPNVK